MTNISQQYVKVFFFFSMLWSVSNQPRFDCTSIIHNSTQNGPNQHCAASTCTTNWSIIFWNANINHWPNFGCDHHFYYWFRSIYTRRLDCRKNEFRFVENVPFGNACTQNKSILWTFCYIAFIYFQNKKGLIQISVLLLFLEKKWIWYKNNVKVCMFWQESKASLAVIDVAQVFWHFPPTLGKKFIYFWVKYLFSYFF